MELYMLEAHKSERTSTFPSPFESKTVVVGVESRLGHFTSQDDAQIKCNLLNTQKFNALREFNDTVISRTAEELDWFKVRLKGYNDIWESGTDPGYPTPMKPIPYHQLTMSEFMYIYDVALYYPLLVEEGTTGE